MKPLLLLLLAMSIPAAAQSADTLYQQACGPKAAKFTVEQVKGQPSAAPEPGKALVYFIQKESGMPFITRVGLDGSWVGVVQEDSYIAVSVAPGEHHACVASQNTKSPDPELIHFTTEAGKVYYYLIRGMVSGGSARGTGYDMLFSAADPDEALFLLASYPRSVATPKP